MNKEKVALDFAELYAGKLGLEVVKLLLEKGEMTDEEIAEKLSLQVGQVRKVLYLLQDKGVVSSRLERNPESGWITYFWYVPLDLIPGLALNLKKKILERLEVRLKYERENVFYWCRRPEDPRLTFELAVDNLFLCPVCGKKLKPYDNSEIVAALSWAISKLRKEIDEIFERSS